MKSLGSRGVIIAGRGQKGHERECECEKSKGTYLLNAAGALRVRTLKNDCHGNIQTRAPAVPEAHDYCESGVLEMTVKNKQRHDRLVYANVDGYLNSLDSSQVSIR